MLKAGAVRCDVVVQRLHFSTSCRLNQELKMQLSGRPKSQPPKPLRYLCRIRSCTPKIPEPHLRPLGTMPARGHCSECHSVLRSTPNEHADLARVRMAEGWPRVHIQGFWGFAGEICRPEKLGSGACYTNMHRDSLARTECASPARNQCFGTSQARRRRTEDWKL